MHNNIGIKSIIFRGKTKFLGLVLKIKIEKSESHIYIYITLIPFRKKKIGKNRSQFLENQKYLNQNR